MAYMNLAQFARGLNIRTSAKADTSGNNNAGAANAMVFVNALRVWVGFKGHSSE